MQRIIVLGCGLPVQAGTIAGWMAAVGLGRFGDTFLFDVTATDPPTFGAVADLLAAAGIGVALIPAQRAAGADPMGALQEE